MHQISPFQQLGVSESATEGEIKAAFRNLAARYHPDKESGSDKAFINTVRAYRQAISISKKRGNIYVNKEKHAKKENYEYQRSTDRGRSRNVNISKIDFRVFVIAILSQLVLLIIAKFA